MRVLPARRVLALALACTAAQAVGHRRGRGANAEVLAPRPLAGLRLSGGLAAGRAQPHLPNKAMGYLSDLIVTQVLARILLEPQVQHAVTAWRTAWTGNGLPPEEVDVKFVGAVFVNDGAEPELLPEAERARAADPKLYQLVFLNSETVGLDVATFDDLPAAEAKLATLGPDESGEGGGIIFHAGQPVKDKLFLKYLRKEDFSDYLQRAIAPPKPTKHLVEGGPEHTQAVEDALLDKLDTLRRLAPEIGNLKREYEGKHLTEPQVIYGKPSPAMVEFAKRFPDLVRLGGCSPPAEA